LVPQLLEMSVRFFTPFLARAAMRFSGFPHRPNPPNITVAPSGISATAASALATTLFMSPPGSALDHQGDALAATDAERGHAPLLPGVLQRLEQGHQQPGPRGADGVTERGRAAADVHPVRVELEDLVVGDGHHGEGLVDLPEVHVVRGGLRPLEELLDRVGW